MFGPFHPFWIRKPVPVIPSIQFPPSMHHPSASSSSHPPIAHHQNHCVPFNFMNFRSNASHTMADSDERKVMSKKDYFDSATIQSIKNELFSGNNNNNVSASESLQAQQQQQGGSAVAANSYEDEDFNNDNIDVETDSDNEQQQLCELKQLSYHNLSDASAIKSEEWSKIMKNTMMIKSNQIEQLIASANDASISPYSGSDNQQGEREQQAKRVLPTDDDDGEYLPFTDHSLLNLGDKKKGKFGNTKGFSIENLIGRMVEDR
jgi:hypothetical protein